MEFWKTCYEMGYADIDTLSQAVKTDSHYGDLTKEQFKEICGVDYDEYIKEKNAKK